MNILIVDDNETNRKVLRVSLEAEGHKTVEVCDGVDALESLKREPLDAIVSDVLMPRMDGYRLCYEVKRNKDLWDLPFIVYSSTHSSPADEKLARDFGADEFIRKPGGIKEILAALQNRPRNASSRTAPASEAVVELSVMREYSELLVHKLEENNSQVELTREKLVVANQELVTRTEELELARADLRRANDALESRVHLRTAELEAANQQLESFGYSVSHDLRAPLRAVDGFARMLRAHTALTLDETGQHYLEEIGQGARRMGELIDAMLDLSRLGRAELIRRRIDLSAMAADVMLKLGSTAPDRKVEIVIARGLSAEGDPALVTLAIENLFNNAWKYTAKRESARIEFGAESKSGCTEFFVRDNGAGFDMSHASNLFGVFKRMHSEHDFPGIGIGLASVRRILERHGGTIRAESSPDHGTTFFFKLAADGLPRP